MRYALLLLGIALLVSGCISSPQAQNQTPPPAQNNTPPQPPPNTTPAMSCNDYCITLPHVQCVGSWKISGTYPSCVCTYECAQSPPNATNGTVAPPQPPEPLATPTNKSVSDMLSDAMASLRTNFYKSHSGTFNEKSYTWQRQPAPSGGITFDMAPASDVLFDGKGIDSIRASGFYVFTNADDDSQTSVGVSVFQAKATLLDNYTGSDVFKVGYFPPSIGYNLTGCYVTTKDYEIDPQSNWYLTYVYSCEKAVAK